MLHRSNTQSFKGPVETRRNTAVFSMPDSDELGNVTQYLCDQPMGVEWLLEKLRTNVYMSKDVNLYLKKRAAIEEEYGRSMAKLAQSMNLHHLDSEATTNTFTQAWQILTEITAKVASNRNDLSKEIRALEDDLNRVSKDCERTRKQIKDSVNKHRKQLSDAELQLEKSKAKFDVCNEELNRIRTEERMKTMQRDPSINKKSLLDVFSKKERTEEECWLRTNEARDVLNEHIDFSRELQTEYTTIHLPHVIKSLKESSDEFDTSLQLVMLKYINSFEHSIVTDAELLVPADVDSLKQVFSRLDHAGDLREFLGHCSKATPINLDKPVLMTIEQPQTINFKLFGKDLADLSADVDEGNPPKLVTVLIEEIEKYGLDKIGLYKVSSSESRLERLKSILDDCPSKRSINSSEWLNDMVTVANVLKSFFMDLPEPLLTFALRVEFVKSCDIEDKKERQLRIHELVNELPDINYVTLRYLAKHLLKVNAVASNRMGINDLSLIFGPILVGSFANDRDPVEMTSRQALVIRTILESYMSIF